MKNPPVIDRWPKVKGRADGAVLISGWYLDRRRLLWLVVLLKWAVAWSALALLITGSLAAFESVPPGRLHRLLALLADARTLLVHAVPEGWPPWIRQDLQGEYSSLLIFSALVAGACSFPIAWLLSRVVGPMLPGLTLRRVRVRVYPDRVCVGWKSFARHPQAPIQFMAEPEPLQPRRRLRYPLYRVCMRYGYRSVPVARDLRQQGAERISAALSFARDACDAHDAGGSLYGADLPEPKNARRVRP